MIFVLDASSRHEISFQARWFYLDQPQRALLVTAECRAPYVQKLLLYFRAGKGWRKIFEGLGNTLLACAELDPPCPARSRSERGSSGPSGWPDLSLLNARITRLIVNRFDGNAYKAGGCYDVKDSNSKLRYDPCPPDWRSAKQQSRDLQ